MHGLGRLNWGSFRYKNISSYTSRSVATQEEPICSMFQESDRGHRNPIEWCRKPKEGCSHHHHPPISHRKEYSHISKPPSSKEAARLLRRWSDRLIEKAWTLLYKMVTGNDKDSSRRGEMKNWHNLGGNTKCLENDRPVQIHLLGIHIYICRTHYRKTAQLFQRSSGTFFWKSCTPWDPHRQLRNAIWSLMTEDAKVHDFSFFLDVYEGCKRKCQEDIFHFFADVRWICARHGINGISDICCHQIWDADQTTMMVLW